MTPNALQLLANLQTFLSKDVFAAVPQSMRSDVRAAAKSLENALQELDRLYPLLIEECKQLAAIAAEANALVSLDASVGAYRSGVLPASLSQLAVLHGELLDRIGDLIVALQSHPGDAARELLRRIYAMLEEHGRARLQWQSVFTADRPISSILVSSWPTET